jgi:tetratricopeptide (TPR) repeat protein
MSGSDKKRVRPCHYLAFYSYKGGVGRTLSMVNVARWLVNRYDKRVVVMDFDLEAPGLDHFPAFNPVASKTQSDKLKKERKGFVEYLQDYVKDKKPPDSLGKYVHKCHPARNDDKGKLWIMPAGRHKSPEYQDFLHGLDWTEFYRKQNGAAVMENLRGHIMAEFEPDYVLMDARTGISEMGGIATHQLADYVVVLFNLNEQNLHGAKRFHDSIKKLEKPPEIILAASPIPAMPAGAGTPFRTKMNWVKKNLPKAVNSEKPIVIPYQPRLSWDECILVDDKEDPFGSDKAYCELGELIFERVMDPEDPKKKAGELWQEGKLDEAAKVLKLSKEQTPESYALLGFVLAGGNKQAEAIIAYQKAIELKPDYEKAWCNLGSAFIRTGQFEEGIKACNKAIRLKPDRGNNWYNLACAYSRQNDKKTALSNLEKAIQLDEQFRKMSQEDEDFKSLLDDPEFKRIVGSK